VVISQVVKFTKFHKNKAICKNEGASPTQNRQAARLFCVQGFIDVYRSFSATPDTYDSDRQYREGSFCGAKMAGIIRRVRRGFSHSEKFLFSTSQPGPGTARGQNFFKGTHANILRYTKFFLPLPA